MSAHPTPIPQTFTISEASLNDIGLHVEHILGAVHALDVVKGADTAVELADRLASGRATSAQFVLIESQCAAIISIVEGVFNPDLEPTGPWKDVL